jgi:hypothetical protein
LAEAAWKTLLKKTILTPEEYSKRETIRLASMKVYVPTFGVDQSGKVSALPPIDTPKPQL